MECSGKELPQICVFESVFKIVVNRGTNSDPEMAPSSRSYLFTSATVRIPVHIAPKCCTEPIRYVLLHFRRSFTLL